DVAVAELGRDYAARIVRIQPHGPYRIAGWSAGGRLAHEVVRVLEQGGHGVSFVALFDTRDPGADAAEPAPTVASELDQLRQLVGDETLLGDRDYATVAQLWGDFTELLAQRREWDGRFFAGKLRRYRTYLRAMAEPAELDAQALWVQVNRIRSLARSVATPPAGTIAAPVHYFQPEFSRNDPQRWRPLCSGELHVHRTKGDHFSMFQEPAVILLAADFLRYTEQVSS
ncbi:MAG: thioesterase domain-containing protein, partial [Myxococcota bacterium]